eukprot:jgi/Orpsp1_1/1178473/evm.model.c7180000065454.1
MNKLIVVLLFCGNNYTHIYCISAVNTFIEKGQRPEIFELTDNDIAVFRITLPDEDFDLLKEKANVEGIAPAASNLTLQLELIKQTASVVFSQIFFLNYTEILSDKNVNLDLSGLFIRPDGYPDVEKIIENIDFDPKHYIDFDFAMGNIIYEILALGNYNYLGFIQQMAMFLLSSGMNDPEHSTTHNASLIEATKMLDSIKENLDTEVKPINNILSNSSVEEVIEQQEPINQKLLKLMELMGAVESDIKYKTKNGSLSVNIAGKQQNFDKITFSLSGQYSRSLVKPNFNLKIRGKKDLFGRSQFKLRSDYTEPTFLRSKLTSDLHKKLGLPGICANYATLYINDEYMGLFVLTDAYKLSWVEQVYDEKDTTSLYKCENSFLSSDSANICTNENDEITDSSVVEKEWSEFINAIVNANSAKDIEDIFEVDHFIKEMAIEYLIGGLDHIQLGHNYYLYKQPNGKWIYLSYDHDHTFGINLDRIFVGIFYVDLPERMEKFNFDYPNYSFADWTQKRHLIDILILNDPTRFNEIIKEIVSTVFNPATLFLHIDELKEFIRPYTEMDYTPDKNGNYPGRINKLGINPYTFEHWEANSEFTSVATIQYNAYGIKYWILAKYRNICRTYDDLECDPVYLDENFHYEVDEKVQFKEYDFSDVDFSRLVKAYDAFLSDSSNTIVGEPMPTATETPSIDLGSMPTATGTPIVDIGPTPTFTNPNQKDIILPKEDKSDLESDIEGDINHENKSDLESDIEGDINHENKSDLESDVEEKIDIKNRHGDESENDI